MAAWSCVLTLLLAAGCTTDDASDDADLGDDTAAPVSTDVVLPLAELDTTAVFLEYEAEEATVYYFAVLDADGEAHVAIDASEFCWDSRRGFRQEGDEMVCNTCGQRFDIDELGEHEGECNPGLLDFTVDDVQVTIQPEALEAAGRYFQ